MKNKLYISFSLALLVSITACKKDKKPTTNTTNTSSSTDTVGLIFAYNFNSNLNDTSANNNNINQSNSNNYYFTSDRNGSANKAIMFNGNGKLALSVNQSYKVGFPFTLSFWLNVPDSAANNRFFYSDDNSTYYGFWAQTSPTTPGKITFTFGNGGGSGSNNRNTAVSSLSITNNTWHHVMGVFKNANDFDIYINGVKDPAITYSGSATNLVYSSSNGFIGALPYLPQYLNGKMDNVKLWKKALNSTQANAEFIKND